MDKSFFETFEEMWAYLWDFIYKVLAEFDIKLDGEWWKKDEA